jgi:hypothetical protein
MAKSRRCTTTRLVLELLGIISFRRECMATVAEASAFVPLQMRVFLQGQQWRRRNTDLLLSGTAACGMRRGDVHLFSMPRWHAQVDRCGEGGLSMALLIWLFA